MAPDKFTIEIKGKKEKIASQIKEIENKINGAAYLDQNAKELLLARLKQMVSGFALKFEKQSPTTDPEVQQTRDAALQEVEALAADKGEKFKASIGAYMIGRTHGSTIVRDWINFGAATTVGVVSLIRVAATSTAYLVEKIMEHIQQNEMMSQPRPRVAIKSGFPESWINTNSPKGPISWVEDVKGSVVKTYSGVVQTLSQRFLRPGPSQPGTDKKIDYRSGRVLDERDYLSNFKQSWLRFALLVGIPLAVWHEYKSAEDAVAAIIHKMEEAPTPDVQRWVDTVVVDHSPAAVDAPYYSGPAGNTIGSVAPTPPSVPTTEHSIPVAPLPVTVPHENVPAPEEVKVVKSETPEGFKGHETEYKALQFIKANIVDSLKKEQDYTLVDKGGVMDGLIVKVQRALEKDPALFGDDIIKKALDSNSKESVAARFESLVSKLNKDGHLVYDDSENILLGTNSSNIEEFVKKVDGKLYNFVVVKGVGGHAFSVSSSTLNHFYSYPDKLIYKANVADMMK